MAQLNSTQRSELKGEIVYIIGAISKDPNFKNKFAEWESEVKNAGAKVVLNPALLPAGMTEDFYMEVGLAAVRHSTAIFALPDWAMSQGAMVEKSYAYKLGKKMVFAQLI